MAGRREIRLAVLAGDGIGPEITAATVQVLKAAARRAGLAVRLKTALIGWKAYRKSRTTLPDATLAVHGTAPDIAGRQQANPSALILSTAMLLRWFHQRSGSRACRDAADLIDRAVKHAILSGATTPDLGGSASTNAFARSVVSAMK